MAYSVSHVIGTTLTTTVPTNPNSAGVQIPTEGPLGLQVFGSDGLLYVLAVADATIAASTAVCDIDPETFEVAATGGAYTSPPVALAAGDVAWFSKASV
jgi:hypothetical protein